MGKSIVGELPNGYIELINVLDKFYRSTGRTDLSTAELISLLVDSGISNANAKNIINRANNVIVWNIKYGMYAFDMAIVVGRLYTKAYIKSKVLKLESEIKQVLEFDISKTEFELAKMAVDRLQKLVY